jgi:hypothetical protein
MGLLDLIGSLLPRKKPARENDTVLRSFRLQYQHFKDRSCPCGTGLHHGRDRRKAERLEPVQHGEIRALATRSVFTPCAWSRP